MKSEHRHELETNVLAKHLDQWVARIQPYMGTIVGIIAVTVAAIIGWSLYSGSETSQQTEAWNAYNEAVVGYAPDLEQLHESAEEFRGTKMKELADITWADGQVWMATREYVYNRSAATEALQRAESTYESVIRTTSDPRLENRARLGLARIYEMRNELDKAKAEYEKVQGGFEEIAKMRAERLADAEAKETYDWLATAQAPRPRAPLGPGTPGQVPDFSVGDMQLPGAPAGATPSDPGTSLDTLFEGLNLEPQEESPDRYNIEEEATPPTEGEMPAEGADVTEAENAAEPAGESPSTEQPPAEEGESAEQPAE